MSSKKRKNHNKTSAPAHTSGKIQDVSPAQPKTDYRNILGNALWVLSVVMLFLTGYREYVAAAIILAAAVHLLAVMKDTGRGAKISLLIPGLTAIAANGYFLSENHILLWIAFAGAFGIGVWEEVRWFLAHSYVWKKTYPSLRAEYIFRVIKTVALTAAAITLVIMELNPKGFMSRMTDFGENRSEYAEKTVETEGGIMTERNAVYGDMPNSICDIHVSSDTEQKGTVIWVHGGDYLNGDKEDISRKLLQNSLREGYAVVSMNYAFAPEYRFPVPVQQLDDLIAYLQKDSSRELNLNKIVLAGTGCGADIAVQYVTAFFHPAYAEKNDMKLNSDGSRITGVYLSGALYTPEDGAKTGLILTDLPAYHSLRLYYGNDLMSGRTAKNANVMPYLTENMPELFIIDGNSGTYNGQAHIVAEQAEKLGILFHECIYDDSKDNRELLYRSFDLGRTSYADSVHSRFIELLRSRKE
ncbi:MAG: alpha/beta hydrolase [Solobacterium sp.]|nr:alpha/beta hydrolase [Solobacterium sp.]